MSSVPKYFVRVERDLAAYTGTMQAVVVSDGATGL